MKETAAASYVNIHVTPWIEMNDRVESGRKDVYSAAGRADSCQCAGVDSHRVVIQVDQRADIRRKVHTEPNAGIPAVIQLPPRVTHRRGQARPRTEREPRRLLGA